MRRAELQHPGKSGAEAWQADVYLEGSDQHRGWFQSSLLLSLAGNKSAPFKTVLTHGFMVDADREKISKSKQGQGGYEKPQTAEAYVSKYGADVVRLWVASQDYRNDLVVSEERINKVGETYRNLRNTLRANWAAYLLIYRQIILLYRLFLFLTVHKGISHSAAPDEVF